MTTPRIELRHVSKTFSGIDHAVPALTVYDTGDTSSFVDSKIQTAGWASNTVGSASLTGTYADGDWMTLKFTMTGDSGKNAKLGEVTLKYNRE